MNTIGLFKINVKDLSDAAINAVIAAVFVGLAGLVSTPGFDVFHADYFAILHSVVNWAVAGFVGSLGKDFLTTSQGNLMGMIKVK